MADAQQPWIKICGLRDSQTTRAAVASGASALGFMLAESRRRIEPESVAAILSEMPVDRPAAVGVVVNESAESIDRMVQETGIDIVQLAGDESPDMLVDIEHAVWKALYFPAGTTLQEASRVIESWLSPPRPAAAILIDAAVPGSYGGTGHKADWELAAYLAERYPVILAGGLNPLNVAEAIGQVQPLGVDVSSGVEVDGSKDVRLIQEFLAVSQRAFAQSSKVT